MTLADDIAMLLPQAPDFTPPWSETARQYTASTPATLHDLASKHGILVHFSTAWAYCRWDGTEIAIPQRRYFDMDRWYNRVLAHELIHWTGAQKNLTRFHRYGPGSGRPLLKEEIIAELGSIMLCLRLNLIERVIPRDLIRLKDYFKDWGRPEAELYPLAEEAMEFLLA
jgi:antirestriction protein ArdC